MTRVTRAARPRATSIGLSWRLGITMLAALLLVACTRTGWGPPTTSATADGAAGAVASARPSTGPRPSRAPKAHELAIAAFVEHATSGTWTYRMSFKGVTAATADSLPTAGRMDVSGTDFASNFTYDYSKEYQGVGKIRVQIRAVNGKGYRKIESDPWRTIRGYRDEDTNIPFAAIRDIRDVDYLGPAEVDGKVLHKISVPNAVLIHPTTIEGFITEERIRRLTLELLIDDEGRPVSGTWRLSATARVQGQLQEVAYNLDLTFSKVGAELAIKKP